MLWLAMNIEANNWAKCKYFHKFIDKLATSECYSGKNLRIICSLTTMGIISG